MNNWDDISTWIFNASQDGVEQVNDPTPDSPDIIEEDEDEDEDDDEEDDEDDDDDDDDDEDE